MCQYALEEREEVEGAITVIMANVAVAARVGTIAPLMCTALRGTLMRTAARKSYLALRTEAVPVACKARLGSPDIRYRVTAEPEGIMSAGIANCLGRRRSQIPGRGTGQQSEHHDCCKPNASQFDLLHLARP